MFDFISFITIQNNFDNFFTVGFHISNIFQFTLTRVNLATNSQPQSADIFIGRYFLWLRISADKFLRSYVKFIGRYLSTNFLIQVFSCIQYYVQVSKISADFLPYLGFEHATFGKKKNTKSLTTSAIDPNHNLKIKWLNHIYKLL